MTRDHLEMLHDRLAAALESLGRRGKHIEAMQVACLWCEWREEQYIGRDADTDDPIYAEFKEMRR